LEQELADEYGGNVRVQEIEPGSVDDPLNRGSAPAAASTATAEGATATEAGTAAGGQATAPGATEDEEDESSTATAGGEDETSEEDTAALQRLDDFLEEERARIRKEVEDTIVPRVQSGLDRQIADLKRQNEDLAKQQEETNRQIREQYIASLSPEEQVKMREAWANEDTAKENDSYAAELQAYHDDLDFYRLMLEHGEYVKEEDLQAVEPDRRELFCKDKAIEWLRANPAGVTQAPKVNGAQPKPQAAQPKRQPAPAGARAPSDTGGGAPPNPSAKQVEGKGLDAMAASVGDRDSWETFPVRR